MGPATTPEGGGASCTLAGTRRTGGPGGSVGADPFPRPTSGSPTTGGTSGSGSSGPRLWLRSASPVSAPPPPVIRPKYPDRETKLAAEKIPEFAADSFHSGFRSPFRVIQTDVFQIIFCINRVGLLLKYAFPHRLTPGFQALDSFAQVTGPVLIVGWAVRLPTKTPRIYGRQSPHTANSVRTLHQSVVRILVEIVLSLLLFWNGLSTVLPSRRPFPFQESTPGGSKSPARSQARRPCARRVGGAELKRTARSL